MSSFKSETFLLYEVCDGSAATVVIHEKSGVLKSPMTRLSSLGQLHYNIFWQLE